MWLHLPAVPVSGPRTPHMSTLLRRKIYKIYKMFFFKCELEEKVALNLDHKLNKYVSICL